MTQLPAHFNAVNCCLQNNDASVIVELNKSRSIIKSDSVSD